MVSESISFYEPNKLDDLQTYAFTTADEDNANFLYDRSTVTKLLSESSADGTNEKLLITFASPQTLDKIAVLAHNIKTGNVKYLNVSLAETDFSTSISWSNNTTTTNDTYDFTSVTAYGIALNCTYTQDAGEKSVGQLLGLEEVGSIGAPHNISPTLKIKKNLKEKVDGGIDKLVEGVKHGVLLDFDNMITADLEVYYELAGRGRPFFIWLSPLSDDQDKLFFREQDFYLVNMTNDAEPEMYQGLTDKSWMGSIEVMEV